MSPQAMARETIADLRRIIARIEGRPAGTLQPPAARERQRHACRNEAPGLVLRRSGHAALPHQLVTGAQGFDDACGGGLPLAALGEIHAAETRNAGAAAGLALGLACCIPGAGPVIWVGVADAFAEAGLPHAPGIAAAFGIAAHELYLCTVPRPADALWVAEEAAGLKRAGCVIVEMRGRPKALGLTATRRLHRRAVLSGRPVFLLRHACGPSPTAASWRVIAAPAPSAERAISGGMLHGSLGAPHFLVVLDKAPAARGGQFILEWSCDDRCFRQISTAHNGAVFPASSDRPDKKAAPRQVMAFEPRRRAG